MSNYPIFLQSKRQSVLLVGSGAMAMAKLRLLLDADLRVTLVAKDAYEAAHAAGLDGTREKGELKILARNFDEADLAGRSLVYVATDDEAEAEKVAAWARLRNVTVNVVDKPSLSDFITPAMIERGPIRVAFATGGKAPVFARRLRAALETILSGNLGELAEAAGRLRGAVKSIIKDETARRRFWDNIFDRADDPLFSGHGTALDEAIIAEAGKADQGHQGHIQLVGAGPGDPELLTLKAHRALQQADVIVYDKLVTDGVLALARRDAEFIYVGKSKGQHSKSQDEINTLLVEQALLGKRVVRLKSGDPLVFGRAGEELATARDAGIPVTIVPGITALSGIAASTQIPMTHRDHAQAVTLVTGHLKDGDLQDFAGLAREGRTLAVYMGLTTAHDIEERLLSYGLSAQTPVAIVENGTRENERRFYGTLVGLSALVESNQIKPPALLIIGEVAGLAVDLLIQKDISLTG